MKKILCLFVALFSFISVFGSFTIEVSNVEATSFHITIAPDSNDVYYIAYFVTLEDWDNGAVTINSLQSDLYSTSVWARADSNYTYELLSDVFLEHGYVSCDVNYLNPNTEYVIYTCAVNEHTWVIKSNIDTVHVKTLPCVWSENIIDLSFDGDILDINCTNNDRYFIVIEPEEEYCLFQSDFSQESLKAEVSDLYFSWVNGNNVIERDKHFVYYGSQSIDVRKVYCDAYAITPVGDYVVLVAGVTEDYLNTDVSYLQIYLDEKNDEQAIDVVENNKKLTKRIENNNIVIYQDNDTKYNILGNKIK